MPHAARASRPTRRGAQTLDDAGNPIALSSPNVANLDGQPSVVVGDRAGKVYAYHLSGGASGRAAGPTTPARRSTRRRRSPPSTPTARHGLRRERRRGAPDRRAATRPSRHSGGDQWFVQETNPGTDPVPHSGVAASLTVGNYAGGYGVEAGSLGQNTVRARRRQRRHAGRLPLVLGRLGVLDGRGGRPLRRRQQRDHQRRRLERRRRPTGRPTATAGTSASSRAPATLAPANPAGGLICQYNTNQNIDRSSPAVGQFLAGGGVGIVIGDGSFYAGRLGLQQGLRHQHRLRPGLERHAQRRHGRLARPGRRAGQRAARRRRGHGGEHRLRAQRHQRRRRLVGRDHAARSSARR